MELCYKWKVTCAIWCSLEIIFFGGIIYGWCSLVFIFKEEGFYRDLCLQTEQTNISDDVSNYELSWPNKTRILTFQNKSEENDTPQTCTKQDAMLNLWFSIAVGFMYTGLAVAGQMTSKLGTRMTRSIFMCVYLCGTLCIAFASPSVPWLLCPGLCCIGLSGLVMFTTSIQVSNLFPHIQSTVVAVFCGLCDASSIVQQVVKVAYESGIGIMYSYLFVSVICVTMFSISTFFFLPRDYVVVRNTEYLEQELQVKITDEDEQNNHLLIKDQDKKEQNIKETKDDDGPSLQSCLFSATFITHVNWMNINVLMFVTFFGLLNTTLERLSNRQNHIVSHYLDVFAYTTIPTIVLSVVSGMLYDWQRKIFAGEPTPSRKFKPVVLSMILCQLFGFLVYVLPLTDKLETMYLVFAIFTLYRSFVYSTGIAFINEAFPSRHFGPLYGILTFVNGSFSMIQYGLFEWNEKYINSYQHVNTFLICIAFLALLHPIQLWIRSRRHREDVNNISNKSFEEGHTKM